MADRTEYQKKYNINNREKIRKRWVKYREKNRDRIKENGKKYRENNKERIKLYFIENKDRIREQQSEYKKKYSSQPQERLKRNTRSKTQFLIKSGKIQKNPCEVCGEEEVQSHHEDYNITEKVKWLCKEHHYELHTKLRRQILQTNNK